MFENKLLKMHVILLFTVTLAGHLQNMKPAQNCTGFISCTFHAVIHVYVMLFLCYR